MKSSIVRIAKSHCQKYSYIPIFNEIITLAKIATGRLVTYLDSLKCYRLNMCAGGGERGGGGDFKHEKKGYGTVKCFGNHWHISGPRITFWSEWWSLGQNQLKTPALEYSTFNGCTRLHITLSLPPPLSL